METNLNVSQLELEKMKVNRKIIAQLFVVNIFYSL